MRSIVPLTVCGVLTLYFAFQVKAGLESVTPVKISFHSPKIVFLRDSTAQEAAELTKEQFMPKEFVLNAITSEKGELIWCKKTTNEFYKDVFRQKDISEDVIVKIGRASESQLTAILGAPVFSEGPIDFCGTTICEWRTYNGKSGDQKVALQVAAGFRSGAGTNAVFLIVCATGGK
jgi:hypothetical protein